MKEVAEETGSTSAVAKNVVEKGDVEATKEKGNEEEKEKEKEDDKNKKNDKGEKEDGDKDAGIEQEIVFIQDMGFTVKIVSPGAEPFDIQVSSMELVQVFNGFLMNFCFYSLYNNRKEQVIHLIVVFLFFRKFTSCSWIVKIRAIVHVFPFNLMVIHWIISPN